MGGLANYVYFRYDNIISWHALHYHNESYLYSKYSTCTLHKQSARELGASYEYSDCTTSTGRSAPRASHDALAACGAQSAAALLYASCQRAAVDVTANSPAPSIYGTTLQAAQCFELLMLY